jgi:hypothetical protein
LASPLHFPDCFSQYYPVVLHVILYKGQVFITSFFA